MGYTAAPGLLVEVFGVGKTGAGTEGGAMASDGVDGTTGADTAAGLELTRDGTIWTSWVTSLGDSELDQGSFTPSNQVH